MKYTLLTLAMVGGVLLASVAIAADQADPWEATIQKFEEQDKQNPPPKDAVLFVGSSSIVNWDLKQFFPELVCINRGFGGSCVSDALRYAERIVTPYRPRAIVFYAGDNDIAAGKSPEQVAKDFEAFVVVVRSKLPETPIVVIPIKPSVQRWKLVDQQREANRLVEAFCKKQKNITYLAIESVMLGTDGKPKPELFVGDGLHLSPEGYKLWTGLLTPLLK